ncbi:MAG: NAD-dependent epimerase/dehydratase family protein [Hyphomicrobiales bacterium]|nr:NAD-dependent epimerase/dehydratase family protein [Hyphomicrobiales bacterium]
MQVLVTGGVGVIGAWVTRKLVERGLRPVVLDLRPDFSLVPDLEGQLDFVSADITDLDAVTRLLKERGIDRIAHLAVYMAPDMDEQPFRAFSINAQGTVSMLEAAQRTGVTRFVYASSRAVYGETPHGVGEPGYQPLGEEHPKHPIKAYDVCKLTGEHMGQVYRNAFGLEFAALRFAGIYGPGKQARHGKFSLRSRLVEDPFAGKPVRIPGGGDQLDDMIYVDDAAEGIVLATLADRLPHAAYNIASGRGQTLQDFAAAVRAAIPGADIEIGPGSNPLGSDVHYYAIYDITRAREDLGFEPRFDLTAGIRDYVKKLQRLRLA